MTNVGLCARKQPNKTAGLIRFRYLPLVLLLAIPMFFSFIGKTYATSSPDSIDQYIAEPWLSETVALNSRINCVIATSDGSNYISSGIQIIKYPAFGKNPIVLAGTTDGTTNNDSDGILAKEARFLWGLHCPAVDQNGSVSFIEHHNLPDGQVFDTIRIINNNGTLGTLAGKPGGSITAPQDGQQALDATFIDISSVRFGPDGLLYIADHTNGGMVRRLNSNGTLTTIVGNNDPEVQSYNNGGPANEQHLDVSSMSIDFDTGGNLYTNDATKIYKVADDGTIHIIAGSGTNPLVEIKPIPDTIFDNIRGLEVLPNGHIFVLVANGGYTGSAPTFYDINLDDNTVYPFLSNVFSNNMSSDMRNMLHFAYANNGDIYLGSLGGVVDYYIGSPELTPVTAHLSPELGSSLFDETKWYSGSVTFYWQVSDAHGGSRVSAPITVNNEGTNTRTTSFCQYSICSSGSVQVKQDFTQPIGSISNTSALAPLGIQSSRSLTGSVSDNLSGINKVSLIFTNGSQATTLSSEPGNGIDISCDSLRKSCTWSATNPYAVLTSGTITLEVLDAAGNLNLNASKQNFLNLN